MERRLEKKTIIDKVTFFDKETKRDGFYLSILQNKNINITDFPETSQDEKIGQGQMNSMNSIGSFLFSDRDSMKKKVLIILGILFILVIIALS